MLILRTGRLACYDRAGGRSTDYGNTPFKLGDLPASGEGLFALLQAFLEKRFF
jgi:hypothetical protein